MPFASFSGRLHKTNIQSNRDMCANHTSTLVDLTNIIVQNSDFNISTNNCFRNFQRKK